MLLQNIYPVEYVESMEYVLINNNEKLNELNRNIKALFYYPYQKRLISSILLNITQWMNTISIFYIN